MFDLKKKKGEFLTYINVKLFTEIKKIYIGRFLSISIKRHVENFEITCK